MALPQPLHIVRKDLIHLWPETLFVIILFVAYAYAAPSRWMGSEYAPYIAFGALLLKILMVVSWLVLIARAIQDECLVGDRQFWTSRPYHWAKLLAAKAILIVICIYVPFFLMQVYLLKHSGLHPMMVLPALLYNLLLLTVVVIIPLAALSAVTSTFPRVLLTFIGAFLYILFLVILLVVFDWTAFLQMQAPHLDWIFSAIFIGLPAIALFIQYSKRETLIARIVLAVTPLIAVFVFLVTPNNAIISHSYPVVTGASAPSLTDITAQLPPRPTSNARLITIRNYVNISMPVGVSGIDKDIHFVGLGARVDITSPGVNYSSNKFLGGAGSQFGGGRPFGMLSFMLPADVFEKTRTTPVDLHLQLASEQLKTEKPSTWHATLLPFSVPGNGLCTFPSDDPNPNAVPTCRYPLKQPDISFVTAQVAPASCANAPAVPGEGNLGSRGGTSLDFDPVIIVPLNFQTGDPDPSHHYALCPGAELNFVEATTLPNASLILDQKQVTLDPFAARFPDRVVRPGRPQSQPQPAPEQ